jgi:hypothetical protein
MSFNKEGSDIEEYQMGDGRVLWLSFNNSTSDILFPKVMDMVADPSGRAV